MQSRVIEGGSQSRRGWEPQPGAGCHGKQASTPPTAGPTRLRVQAHDRLLLISEAVEGQKLGSILAASLSGLDPSETASINDLTVQHVPLPASYL